MTWATLSARGFTFIELLMTLAIMGVLAMVTVPLAQVTAQRAKEHDLRIALADIRRAIDAHKRAAETGRIELKVGESGYPKTLNALVEGVPDQRSPTRQLMFFLRELPRLYANVEDRLATRDRSWGALELPNFLQVGSWIGGDRDGNPFVTAEILEKALAVQAEKVLTFYMDEVHTLGSQLSVAQGLVSASDALLRLAEASPDGSPHRIDEPYRRALTGLYARLAATYAQRLGHPPPRHAVGPAAPYPHVEAFADELETVHRSLVANGLGALARGRLRHLRRAVAVFGFHLAPVDLRQNSDVHERVSHFETRYTEHEAMRILAGLGFAAQDPQRDLGFGIQPFINLGISRTALARVVATIGSVIVPFITLTSGQYPMQSEINVVARSGDLLLRNGIPYLPDATNVTDINPYLPMMAVFGVPRALLARTGIDPGSAWNAVGDPRLWCALIAGIAGGFQNGPASTEAGPF